MENLFSYGTLQYESVQMSTFGRILSGTADALTGFKLSTVKIEDEAVVAASGQAEHPIISRTNSTKDMVEGMVLQVTEAELSQADEYEVADYKRISVTLKSGKDAWVYVKNDTPVETRCIASQHNVYNTPCRDVMPHVSAQRL